MVEVDPHISSKAKWAMDPRHLYDLFGDLVIISLTLMSEAGRNISSIFRLNITYSSMEILHVLFGNRKWSYS